MFSRQSLLMSGNGSNFASVSTSSSLPPRNKNVGWNVLDNGKKLKRNYCSKTFNGVIFKSKHHLAGTRYDFEPCVSVSEDVKVLMNLLLYELLYFNIM